MADPSLDRRVDAARRFNRFYTNRIGVLHEGLLRSPYSLTEARLLYELAQRDGCAAVELSRALNLDAGYLSRLLRALMARGLVARQTSPADGRRRLLRLTRQGRAAFTMLDGRSRDEVRSMLRPLSESARRQLLDAMETIERLLGGRAPDRMSYLLRPPRAGDLGWVVERHGALYAQEYGWDERFEGLVAGIVAKFVTRFDPRRERCWIAEKDGANVGSVFLVRKSAQIAKLRLLLVEPQVRGLGIGKQLVAECVRFAREVGYRKVTLWTNSVLTAARHLYEETGFQLVAKEQTRNFGHDLVSETWELTIHPPG